MPTKQSKTVQENKGKSIDAKNVRDQGAGQMTTFRQGARAERKKLLLVFSGDATELTWVLPP